MSTKPDVDSEGASAGPDDDADDELDLANATVEQLAQDGDAEGLFLLARAARQGSHGRPKHLGTAFAAYRAAGELGHADADYAAALFYMNGTGTPRDYKEGAARLRRSAERGSLDAKIYLGNLYELGVHYAKDSEKADVWYRNAARAAKLSAAPGSPAMARALAGLGAIRHAEALAADPAVPEEEREAALRKARARGASLRDQAGASAPSARDDSTPAPAPGQTATTATTPAGAAAERATTDPEATHQARLAELSQKAKPPSKLASKLTGKAGVGAFLYALLFSATAFGAAFAAEAGARELVAHGGKVPLFGGRVDLVFPVMLAVVAVLPQLLVYRLSSVLRGLALGGAGFGVGWVLHGTGKLALTDARLMQGIAFAGAGFLAALLAQGLFGGAKGDREPARRRA